MNPELIKKYSSGKCTYCKKPKERHPGEYGQCQDYEDSGIKAIQEQALEMRELLEAIDTVLDDDKDNRIYSGSELHLRISTLIKKSMLTQNEFTQKVMNSPEVTDAIIKAGIEANKKMATGESLFETFANLSRDMNPVILRELENNKLPENLKIN